MKHNKNNSSNVPNLRFPEFTGEWKSCKLGDIIKMISGGTPSMEHSDCWNGDIPFISAASMHDTFISSSNQKITEYGLKSGSKLMFKGGLLLLVRGSMLWKKIPICYNNVEVAFNQDVKGLIVNNKSTSIFMLYYLLSKESILKYMVTGTSIGAGKLDSDAVLSIQSFIPVKSEQQKITSFLSLIDERISTQNKIIEKLESLIKGLNDHLHELYSNDIRIRLSDIGFTYSGLTGKTAEDFGIGKPYITYLNVYQNGVIDCEKIGYVKVDDYEEQNQVIFGDALFTLSSETPQEVGIAAVCLSELSEIYLNSFCFGYRVKNFNLLLPGYMPYCFSSSKFRRFILPFAQGSTRYNLQKTDFMNSPFSIPCKLKQEQIANLLSGISGKISNEKKILESYIVNKQYLLSNLFI